MVFLRTYPLNAGFQKRKHATFYFSLDHFMDKNLCPNTLEIILDYKRCFEVCQETLDHCRIVVSALRNDLTENKWHATQMQKLINRAAVSENVEEYNLIREQFQRDFDRPLEDIAGIIGDWLIVWQALETEVCHFEQFVRQGVVVEYTNSWYNIDDALLELSDLLSPAESDSESE